MNNLVNIIATNGLAQFALLLVVTCLGCTKVTIQSRACRKYLLNTQDSVVYNAMFFASVAVALALIFRMSPPYPMILALSGISAVTNVVFQVLYSVCLTCGPVSLTVLIINFSVLIPTAFSVIAFGDKLFLTQFIGIALLIVSMILSVNKTEGEQKASKKWLVLTLVALIANGAGAIVQKVFYKTSVASIENSENTFLVFVYIFATILSVAIYFINSHRGSKEKCTFWFNKNVLFYAMLIGAVIAIFQKLFMLSVELIDGSFMFPTYYGLQSVGMSVIGIAMFKDHLTVKQKLGVLCGAASIVMMNIKLGGAFGI